MAKDILKMAYKTQQSKALTWWNSPGFNGTFEQARLGAKYFPNGFTNFNKNVLFIWKKEIKNKKLL